MINQASQFSDWIVEHFDTFGQAPQLRVLGKQKYTSPIGCFITFLIGTTTLFYLASQFLLLYNKSEPQVVTEEVQIFNTTEFPLFNENFTFAVTIADKNTIPLEGQNKYYNITINHCIREKIMNQDTKNIDVSHKCIPLPIAPCKNDDFNTELQKQFFQGIKLGVVQCIDRKRLKSNPPVLQGIISGNKFQYLAVQISVCKNSTEYQGCASDKEIRQKLQVGYYSVYASDNLMQLDRGDDPYQQFITLDINSFSFTTSKKIGWTYRIQEVHTDDGLLFNQNQISTNLIQQHKQDQSEVYNDDYLVYHYIQLDYKYTIYKRSYIKIQTILSRIGGIWQLFMFVFTVLLNPLIQNLMTIQLANNSFRFPKAKNNLPTEIFRRDPIVDFYKENEHQLYEGELSKGLFHSILIIFGCDRKRKQMFDKAKKTLLEQTDILKILERLQQLDWLKFLLLDEQQHHLFDLIQKPILNLDDQEAQPHLIQLQFGKQIQQVKNINSDRLQKYYQSFSHLSQIKVKNNVDEKLISMLDKNFVKCFEDIQNSSEKNTNIIFQSQSPFPFNQHIDSCKLDSSIILEPSSQKPR